MAGARSPIGVTTMRSKITLALALAGTVLLAAAPASAQRWGHHWHGGGWGWGAPLAGFAAGAVIGSALAAPAYPYGYYPAYTYAPGYAYAPAYAAVVPAGEDAVTYCMSRYKSYDPASGTFLGYDGLRHPCP